MLFSLVTVLGSWCFADRRDSDIPTVKAFKKSHTFIYVYIATWCWQGVLLMRRPQRSLFPVHKMNGMESAWSGIMATGLLALNPPSFRDPSGPTPPPENSPCTSSRTGSPPKEGSASVCLNPKSSWRSLKFGSERDAVARFTAEELKKSIVK